MSLIQVRLPVGTVVQLTAEQVFEMQSELAKSAPAPEAPKPAPAPAPEAPKPAPEPAPAPEPRAEITVKTAKRADVIAWAAEQGRDVQRVTNKLVEAYVEAMNAQDGAADEEPDDEEEVDELAVDTPDDPEDESDDDDLEDIFADDDEDDEDDEDDDQPTYEDLHNAVRAAVKTLGKVEVRNIVKKYSPDNTLRGVPEASYGKLISELA